MESHVKFLGHPIHPMLIVFPLGLLATALIFDVLYLILGVGELGMASYYMIGAGVIGGLLAAAFGFLDWLHVPSGTRAKSLGLMHGGGNVVIVVLFLISLLLRSGIANHTPSTVAFVLELLGGLLALGTAWLGGELVDRLGVGVDEGANANAPSSLSGKPAYENLEGGEGRTAGANPPMRM